jgi:hypothetical protein
MLHLTNFQSITNILHTIGMHILETHVIFDCILESYPSMEKYLATDGQIIHSAEFDSAIVKIMTLVESTLTCSKKLDVPISIECSRLCY